jgi:hypothetical protein
LHSTELGSTVAAVVEPVKHTYGGSVSSVKNDGHSCIKQTTQQMKSECNKYKPTKKEKKVKKTEAQAHSESDSL